MSVSQEEFDAFKAEMKEKIASLEKEVAALSTKGGSSSSAAKPPRRPGTAKKKRPVSRNDSSSNLKKSTSGKIGGNHMRRSSSALSDRVEVDEERVGKYFVGKRKVYYVTPSEAKEGSTDEPEEDLKLEHIFGYNGRDARNNLFWTQENELIYNVAAAGVKFNPKDNKQSFFIDHTEDILSLAVHPTRPLVATGQLDPKGDGVPYVCIWDHSTMEKVAKIGNYHQRGICAVAFSADGRFLASIGNDDNHTLAVWDWEKSTKKPVAFSSVSKDEVFGIHFNPFNQKDIEFVTYGVKHIKYWTMEGAKGDYKLDGTLVSSFKKTNIVQKAYHCAYFLPNNRYVVGTDTGALYVHLGKDFQKSIEMHERPIGAICRTADGFATASSDKVVVWNDQLEKVEEYTCTGVPRAMSCNSKGTLVVGTTRNQIIELGKKEKVIMNGHAGEVWALAMHPEKPLCVTGGHDRAVHTWNYKKMEYAEVSFKYKDERKGRSRKDKPDGIRSAAYTPDGKLIALGFRSGKVIILDSKSMEVVYEKEHRKETIDCIAFSPNGQLLGLGSWDQFAELIDMDSKSSVVLKGHTSSITHLTFSKDSKFLQTNSRDYEILYWNTETGKRVDRNNCADTEWEDWSTILGWPVQGIFGEGMDGTDINCCNINVTNTLVVTGDDFGNVGLHRYPAIKKSKKKKYMGHSSHVTNAHFSPDGKHVVTTGGADTSVFVWAL